MRVDAVLEAVNELHAQDPAGKELHYAERMAHWLQQLDETPHPLLRIAVVAQHLKRWEAPRGAFPTGRKGYLDWRRRAAAAHAELVGEIMSRAGFDPQSILRVADLVTKRMLGADPDAQTLEDCACLVFLETQLDDFRRKHSPAKVARILDKTWAKMSPAAQRLAVAGGYVTAPTASKGD